MASSDNSLAILEAAQSYVYQIGGPILMVIGTIGCLLNLSVFTQKNLRKNPCSIYFIAYNLANLIYIYTSILLLTLAVGFNIDPSAYNLVFCHIRLYIVLLFNCLSPFYLILAAIDRVLITSPNALTRQKSTRRLAYISLGVGTLFWILFHSHTLFLTNITQIAPNVFFCYFEQGIYLTFVSYYQIMKEIVTFSSMIICGLWSIKNIRSIRRTAATNNLPVSRTDGTTNNLRSTSSKDRQLVFMLLMDISIYALFSFVYAISLIYEQITQYYTKSYDQIQIEGVVRYLCLYIIGIPFCTSCYTNLIASKTFRNEVKKVLLWQ